MKERPIIFSTPMVQAIIEGRKTQTRRVVNPDIVNGFDFERDGSLQIMTIEDKHGEQVPILDLCPHGKPGDLLWVRETTIIAPKNWVKKRFNNITDSDGDGRVIQYLATHPNTDAARNYGLKKTPSIHMPKWAARIWLEITGIGVKRVQEISDSDIIAEGISTTLRDYDAFCHLNQQFIDLWDSINGKKEGCSWAENPWVWIVEFKRVEVK